MNDRELTREVLDGSALVRDMDGRELELVRMWRGCEDIDGNEGYKCGDLVRNMVGRELVRDIDGRLAEDMDGRSLVADMDNKELETDMFGR